MSERGGKGWLRPESAVENRARAEEAAEQRAVVEPGESQAGRGARSVKAALQTALNRVHAPPTPQPPANRALGGESASFCIKDDNSS